MNYLKAKYVISIAWIFISLLTQSQQITSFNENWSFLVGADTLNQSWKNVRIPHTWNDSDPFDKEAGYYRGLGWYKKEFSLEPGSRYFMVFEGVNQEADVFINGKKAGEHKGGYTAFNLEITEFLKSSNTVIIKVDNSHDVMIPPLKGDFNFYGGIYRDVWIYKVNDIHFDLSQYGDKGIFVGTKDVSEESARVVVTSNINNQTSSKTNALIEHELFDGAGKLISKISKKLKLVGGLNAVKLELPLVENPQLWHPDSPNLYRLKSTLKKDGITIDTQSNPVGFRWFKFDADQGFFINGKSLKLMGANRHQDYLGLGNALLDERHIADVEAIKNMGSNFFRTAHYPQDPAVMDAADKLGLIVSVEIPLDHEITDNQEFLDNSIRMLREMIRQNYNHPSVVIWAYMNEMMLGRNWERDKEVIERIRLQAIQLEEVVRTEDPDRYTMIPNHGDLDLYIKSGLTEIPMIVGWNLYFGWYEKDIKGAGKFLDQFHALVPQKPVLITEYGAGADQRIRSLNPERFDFSIEWQNKFHQENLIQFDSRDYLAGAAIWNVADFGSESRNDADPKINSKGVLTYHREPKDSYYLYQAWLRKEPVVKIGAKNWKKRWLSTGELHQIDIYTNSQEVELFLNGKSLGVKKVNNHIASWEVQFADGENLLNASIEVDEEKYFDFATIEAKVLDWNNINWYEGININCGATFTFNDPVIKQVWIPDQFYTTGQIFRPRERGIGSDKTIFNTQNDPIYQTNRIDGDYSFKVDPGTYELTFHWAHLDDNEVSVFDVLVNGESQLRTVDIKNSVGSATAFYKKIQVIIEENQLEVGMKGIDGKPFLSGLQIRRIN